MSRDYSKVSQTAGDAPLQTVQSEERPQPLFIYGTLCAKPLLAWALKGDSTKVPQIGPMIKPARARQYTRLAVQNCDYPAVIRSSDEAYYVDGYLLQVSTPSQRKKLDSFEGEIYAAKVTTISILDSEDKPTGDEVEAEIYLWQGDRNLLSSKSWDLQAFISETDAKTGLIFLMGWNWLARRKRWRAQGQTDSHILEQYLTTRMSTVANWKGEQTLRCSSRLGPGPWNRTTPPLSGNFIFRDNSGYTLNVFLSSVLLHYKTRD